MTSTGVSQGFLDADSASESGNTTQVNARRNRSCSFNRGNIAASISSLSGIRTTPVARYSSFHEANRYRGMHRLYAGSTMRFTRLFRWGVCRDVNFSTRRSGSPGISCSSSGSTRIAVPGLDSTSGRGNGSVHRKIASPRPFRSHRDISSGENGAGQVSESRSADCTASAECVSTTR